MPPTSKLTVPAILFAAALLAGCGSKGDVLTGAYEGRRVQDSDVEGQWLAYVWTPAQLVSVQGHVVLMNLADGSETELDGDMSGPMALSGNYLVWCNTRRQVSDLVSPITLYDLAAKSSREIGKARVGGLDAAGDFVVWENILKTKSEVVLYDVKSGAAKTISPPDVESVSCRGPKISDRAVVWETFVWKTRQSSVTVYDLASGAFSSFDVPADTQISGISGWQVLYVTRKDATAEIHLYDIAAKSDRVAVSPPRFAMAPAFDGSTIAWGQYIEKKDFKPIPGQPLFNEKDFRDIFICDAASGSPRQVASSLLTTGAHLAVKDGRVYCAVYRTLPPPGASNLTVPVDLRRF